MFVLGPRNLLRVVLSCLLFPFAAVAAPGPLLNTVHPAVRAVMDAQREVSGTWMKQPEVLATAVGVSSSGQTVLAVYVDRDAPKVTDVVRSLPAQVRNVPVDIRLTDKFHAMLHRHHGRRGKPDPTGISHKDGQLSPVQLGTSGGWSKDTGGRSCCSGTLGALVQIGGQQYVLSNWHVLEADIVFGRNNTIATTGDAVIQPGLTDANCNAANAQTVATLETRNSLPDSNVDCAIAAVIPGKVRPDGAILEIGPISAQTLPAAVNQAVKKSGRTTALTRNVIIGLNATIKVDYDQECSGQLAFTKTFTGQIMVGGGSSFLGDGDSGSLLVEDVATNPRAIGLLYAGSTRDSIANPIDEVLGFLGASMVGN